MRMVQIEISCLIKKESLDQIDRAAQAAGARLISRGGTREKGLYSYKISIGSIRKLRAVLRAL
ncbi:MAG: hypothetical protein ACYDBH_11005 [Acidobacteriaceae bacterium]